MRSPFPLAHGRSWHETTASKIVQKSFTLLFVQLEISTVFNFSAGTSRASSATKRDHSDGSSAKQSIPTPRRCSAPPFRKSRGSSGTNRRFSGTTRASSGTSLRSSLNPRVSSGPPRLSSAGVHRGSPVSFSSSTSMSAEKLLPLVTNDLVLAQGSQRTLVLTQGGSRCNDYQLQIERNIINKYDLKKAFTQSGKVT